jgi:hypothetical protein
MINSLKHGCTNVKVKKISLILTTWIYSVTMTTGYNVENEPFSVSQIEKNK